MSALKQWWKKRGQLLARLRRPAPSPASRHGLVEPLETRQLLSAGVNYLAPATLAGGTLSATIAASTAPLPAAGAYTYQLSRAGMLTGTAADGSAINDATAAYDRINRFTGVLRYTDAATGITYADTLIFADGTTGTFSIAATDSSSGGTQSGQFTFAAVPQPLGADLIANFIKVPNGASVSAGDSTTVVVNIANVGSAGAVGFVTVNFYLSSTGLASGATLVGSAGRISALGLQYSNDVGRRFTFPDTLPSGAYYVVATLTPAAGFSDVDRSNDSAVSAIPIQITSPGGAGNPGSNPSPVTLTSSIAGVDPETLTGGKLSLMFVQLGSSAAFEGNVPINLLATPTGSSAAPTVLSAFTKKIAISAGQSPVFPIRVVPPTALASGTYSLQVQVGPARTRLAGTQQIVMTANSPLSAPLVVTVVQPPVATLTATIGTLPSTIAVTQDLPISIALGNTGTAAARGDYRLQLFAAPIGNPNAIKSIPLLAVPDRPLLIEPGEQQTITFNIHVPRSLTLLAPRYSLVVMLYTSNVVNITSMNLTANSADLFSVT